MKKVVNIVVVVLVILSTYASAGYLTVAYRSNSSGTTTFSSYELSGGSLVTSGSGPSGALLPDTSYALSGIAAGDADNDGISDVYYSYQDGASTYCNVANVSTSFGVFPSATIYGLATTDINRNGVYEACFVGLVEGSNNAYAQNSNGTTAMTVNNVASVSYTMYGTTAGDLNGDGVANEFAFMYRNGSYDYLKVMNSDGSTLYQNLKVNGTYNTVTGITSGNLSDAYDGEEIAYIYSPNSTGANKIVILQPDTYGGLASFDVLDQNSEILGLTAGDMNDDGVAEIILAYKAASDYVYLNVYDTSGTLLANKLYMNGAYNTFGGLAVAGNVVIPEPASFALIATGIAGMISWRKRRV